MGAALDSVLIGPSYVDIKSTVVSFTVETCLNGGTKCVITALKGPCDNIVTPAANYAVSVIGDFTAASNIYIFNGTIRKIETKADKYVLTCYPYAQKLWDFIHNASYNSQDHDVSMANVITSAGFTVDNNHVYSQSIDHIDFVDVYGAYALNKLARFSPYADSDTAVGTCWWCCSTRDGSHVAIQSMYGLSSGTTLSHANGSLLGKLTHLNTAENIINKVIVNHAGGRHSSNNTDNYNVSSSTTAYGMRGKILYLPNINTNADAIHIEDNYLAMYYVPRVHFKVKCKFDKIIYGSGSSSLWLSDGYTVTDNYNGVTYSNVPLIGYKMSYPGWTCEAEFGVPPDDLSTYVADSRADEQVFKRDSAGYGCTFKAYRSGTQSISNSTDTKIQFANEIWDTGGNYDNATNYRFVPPVAGYYFFHAQSDCTLTNGTRCDLYLRISGNNKFMDSMINNQGTTMSFLLQVSGHVYMTTSDYAEVFIFQNTGSSMNITGNEYTNNFSGSLIATAY